MKVYYAHPMSWYGTEEEARDLAVIEQEFPAGTEIVNPNSDEFKARVSMVSLGPSNGREIMAIFIATVEECDAIVYRTFKDDAIGAGVAQELLTAFIWGKQVFRMWDQERQGKGPRMFEEAYLRASFGPRLLTIVETKDRIKRGVM